MKPLLLRTACCMLISSALYIGKSHGQTCPGGASYSTLTYDTTAVGNGNTSFSFVQFDPSIGTLYSVDVSADIYLTYSYTLNNISGVEQDYSLNVRRRDLLKASAPGHTTTDLFTPTGFINTPYDYIVGDPDYPGVPPGVNHYTQNVYDPRHITSSYNIVPFLGADTLRFTYSTTTNYQITGNALVEFTQTGVKDSLKLSITYNYCPSAVLPSTFIKLTAQPQNSNLLFAWTAQQILTGGSFELLKSIDGRTYTSVNKQSVNSNNLAGYNYLYKTTAKDPSKAFFRIKQTDQNGNVTYSKVITVVLPTSNSSGSVEESAEKDLVVYPTIPTGNFVNVFIPSGTNTDEWTISIVSLAGRVMQQSKFSKTNLAKVQFNTPLAPGMYIVDAYNARTQEHFKDKIVVQH